MPKENHLSADRALYYLEDTGYFEGLECVGPYQRFGVFTHPIQFYKEVSSCAKRHQALEALLNSDSIPDNAKPPLQQVAQSSIQAGACVFWQQHGDSRAKSAPCKEAEAVLSQARNEFRRNYPY